MHLSSTDLNRLILDQTPPDVRDVMRMHPREVVLAGGFLRSVLAREVVVDVDLFVPCKDVAVEVTRHLGTTTVGNFSNWKEREHCFTASRLSGVPWPVQVSWRRPFEEPEEVAASFDFTVCMAALWSEGKVAGCNDAWGSWIDERFYGDLGKRVLRYVNPVREEAGGEALLRVLKFVSRGYKISFEQLSVVVCRLVQSADDSLDEDRICDVLKRSDSSSDAGDQPYFMHRP